MPVTTELLLTDDLPEQPILALDTMADRILEVRTIENGLADQEVQIGFFVLQRYAAANEISVPYANVVDPGLNHLDGVIHEIKKLVSPYKAELVQQETAAEVDRLLAKRSDEPGFAVLTASEKSEIASKIEFIRQIVQNSSLAPKKRNVLFKKLNKFSAEVMKDGTDTDTLFAFFGELSLNAGLMAKNAKPALDELKDILRIVLRSRAKREGLSLPSPEDILKLPDMSGE